MRSFRRRRPVRKVPRRDRSDRTRQYSGSVTQPGHPSDLADDPVRGAGRDIGDDDGPMIDREFFVALFEEGAHFEVVADVDVLGGNKTGQVRSSPLVRERP